MLTQTEPRLKQVYAKVRRITGFAPFQSEPVTVGDVLIYNTVLLILSETAMDSGEAQRLLNAEIPQGAKFTLVTYAPEWRLPSANSDHKIYAELQIFTSEDRMKIYQFLDNLTTIERPDEPQPIAEPWWEVPDHIVTGTAPAFASEDFTVPG